MKILITGGCGFIGSNYIRMSLRNFPEDHIVNLDALTYAGNLENLNAISREKNYTFIKGDITDAALLDRIYEEHKFEGIINFAAESHVDRSISDPTLFLRTNIMGTQCLLDLARKHNLQRFLQVSTDEVYGSLPAFGAFSETTPVSPRSPYSASKASADHLVAAYHHTFGLNAVITRCSNNYGPYQFPEKLIPLMIINAFNYRELPVYGDGLYVRDWLHVDDHCRAIEAVLSYGKPGEVYNIGGNNEVQNIELVKRILKTLDRPESLIRHVQDRPGHDRRYAIDASKIKRELGWSPEIDFAEGLDGTIQWYLQNSEWWQKIVSGEYRTYYDKMYANRPTDHTR